MLRSTRHRHLQACRTAASQGIADRTRSPGETGDTHTHQTFDHRESRPELDPHTARVHHGVCLYDGTLTQGRSVSLAGRKLYAEFGALRNLDVYVGQVSVDLSCSRSRGVFLTKDGVLPKPSEACLRKLGS